ncbi:kinase with adenine nucleotide alpha hydrolases-like domain-containing protein [Actinidia rufa]|uniref:Kinase with adenine nucleotide alpha hydrolases-like domain-containing protein n=1 Tax=Actinidia rufa TaxID=165716 RepID=A0A7J0EY36_9ERIC|nr:kinase with adenine nucleotide alpha hydrolases-like domain-containing protein [Actinidia rufa]
MMPKGHAASDGGGGAVVVVGVRMDSQSRELLTCALVKVARSGDRVIALHVFNPITGIIYSLSRKQVDTSLSCQDVRFYACCLRRILQPKTGNRKNGNKFGWEDRFKVALGAAEALDYLHNRAVEPVIHKDAKSSNILLSDDFEPQLQALDSSHYTTCTDVAGTFG